MAKKRLLVVSAVILLLTASVYALGDLTPAERLSDILESLKTIDASEDRILIDNAIKNIENALDENYWTDNSRLDCSKGAKVFEELKSAVLSLNNAQNSRIKETASKISDTTRSIPLILLNIRPATSKDEAQIISAYNRISQGQSNELIGRYDRAIEYYKNAWLYTKTLSTSECSSNQITGTVFTLSGENTSLAGLFGIISISLIILIAHITSYEKKK